MRGFAPGLPAFAPQLGHEAADIAGRVNGDLVADLDTEVRSERASENHLVTRHVERAGDEFFQIVELLLLRHVDRRG